MQNDSDEYQDQIENSESHGYHMHYNSANYELKYLIQNKKTNMTFYKINARQCIFGFVFLILLNVWSYHCGLDYYKSINFPPPFRHMDATCLENCLNDYIKAHEVDSNTVVVLGDCVAYGHGVEKSFVHYISIPNKKIINISMESISHRLRLLIVDAARKMGARSFIIQFHPLVGFNYLDVPSLPNLDTVSVHSADLIIEAARSEFGFASLAAQYKRSAGYIKRYRQTILVNFSAILHSRLLSAIPAYRNRHILDKDYGLQRSSFAKKSKRRNSYNKPLPQARLTTILKRPHVEKRYRWLAGLDYNRYLLDLQKNTYLPYLASYCQVNNLEAAFMQAPIFESMIVAHLPINSEDFVRSANAVSETLAPYNFNLYDYTSCPELQGRMHTHTLPTVEGHRVLGKLLSEDLSSSGFPSREH